MNIEVAVIDEIQDPRAP